MNIDRRHLVLPAIAVGLLGIVPTLAASADEDAVAKSVEAFRVAQIAADAKAFDALCAAELSYSHSDGRVEDKATFIANANLLGLERKPSYMIPIDDGATATAKIATWWRERWLRNRIRSDEVLLELERHTLVRPIRHGGRAVVPPPADQPLLFADLG